jgi:flagellar export protein FliJ
MAGTFRLARLLRLRTQLRRLREHEAATLARRVETLTAEAAEVAAERERQGDAEARAAAAGLLTPAQLHLGREYAAALADAEQKCRTALHEASRQLAAKRDELLASHREERKVQRLEEGHRARVAEASTQHAARALDEVAIDRHRRARMRGGDDGAC